jgi:Trk K+ transport system NAD-binding subunit
METLLRKKANEEKTAKIIEEKIKEDSDFQRDQLREQRKEIVKNANVLSVKLNSCWDSSHPRSTPSSSYV